MVGEGDSTVVANGASQSTTKDRPNDADKHNVLSALVR